MSRRGENIYKRKDGRWEGRYIKGYDAEGKAKPGYVYGKTYKEAKEKLIARFDLTDVQAQAIVDMRLRALTGLEREKLENEHRELQIKIAELKAKKEGLKKEAEDAKSNLKAKADDLKKEKEATKAEVENVKKAFGK